MYSSLGIPCARRCVPHSERYCCRVEKTGQIEMGERSRESKVAPDALLGLEVNLVERIFQATEPWLEVRSESLYSSTGRHVCAVDCLIRMYYWSSSSIICLVYECHLFIIGWFYHLPSAFAKRR